MWNLADGFSPAAPMLVAFPGGVSPSGLPSVDDFDQSLTASSPTVVLDLTTGERVPHFAELDAQAADLPDSQALFIRPASRLVGGHRYAVAITDRVTSASGGISRSHRVRRTARRRDHRPCAARVDAATLLGRARRARGRRSPADELVLAWDFTVASDEFLTREMIATRDRALAAISNRPLGFTIVTDQQPDLNNPNIARYIYGKLDAPLFLNTPSFGVEGTTTVRDGDGLPVVQGFYQIPFAAIVPACAYTSPTPSR